MRFGKVCAMRFDRCCFMPLALAALALVTTLRGGAAAVDADADKTALAVEALGRLQGVDINTNPKLKEAVLKVLEKTRGTANFVKLVQQFKLAGQNEGLLEVAIAQPASESGVEAMRLLLGGDGTTLIEKTLSGTNTVAATKTAEALGNTGENKITKLLLPVVSEPKSDLALRKQSVRSLARTSEGAGELLKLAEAGTLPDDLKFTASTELNAVRWLEINGNSGSASPR